MTRALCFALGLLIGSVGVTIAWGAALSGGLHAR